MCWNQTFEPCLYLRYHFHVLHWQKGIAADTTLHKEYHNLTADVRLKMDTTIFNIV